MLLFYLEILPNWKYGAKLQKKMLASASGFVFLRTFNILPLS